jgi:hypothetical protein
MPASPEQIAAGNAAGVGGGGGGGAGCTVPTPASKDIFGRTASNFKGAFAADLATLTIAAGVSGTLVQSLGLNYGQQVSRLYEVGSANIYYVGGRTQGQLQFGRVIGPNGAIIDLYTTLGDMCKAADNNLAISLCGTVCQSGNNLSGNNLVYKASYCVLDNIGIQTQAQEMVFRENSSAMFGSLTVTPT